jgi:hypothetical protein
MCPICLAVAGLFTALFRPWIRLRRGDRNAAAWRLDDARDA